MSQENSVEKECAAIYQIIDLVIGLNPKVKWSQLQVSHAGADDDGIWFFWLPHMPGEVQLESTTGMLPFVAETDKHNQRVTCTTVAKAAQVVYEWLQLPGGSTESFWHPRSE